MSQRYRVEKAIDQSISRRILSTCWLFAGLGISTFQMLLLAQAWSLNQQAFVPACMASAWVLGALLWLGSTQFISWRTTTLLLPVEGVHLFALAVLAFLLGTISMAWLSQQRAKVKLKKQCSISLSL